MKWAMPGNAITLWWKRVEGRRETRWEILGPG